MIHAPRRECVFTERGRLCLQAAAGFPGAPIAPTEKHQHGVGKGGPPPFPAPMNASFPPPAPRIKGYISESKALSEACDRLLGGLMNNSSRSVAATGQHRLRDTEGDGLAFSEERGPTPPSLSVSSGAGG